MQQHLDDLRYELLRQLAEALQRLQFYKAWSLSDAMAKATDAPLSSRLEVLATLALSYHQCLSGLKARSVTVDVPGEPTDLVRKAFLEEAARLNGELERALKDGGTLASMLFAYYALLQMDGRKVALWLGAALEGAATKYPLPDSLKSLRVGLLDMANVPYGQTFSERGGHPAAVSMYESFQYVQDYLAGVTGTAILDIIDRFGFRVRVEQLVGGVARS